MVIQNVWSAYSGEVRLESKMSSVFNRHFYLKGKVPKEFYTKEESNYNNTSSYNTVVIKKGSKLKLNFDVETAGAFLK
jgi:hypothetical protein